MEVNRFIWRIGDEFLKRRMEYASYVGVKAKTSMVLFQGF